MPYFAPYFGHKGKISQEYGCTHVALVDGCSQMICGYASMEVKNPILIYEYVFPPAILKYGLYGISQELIRDKSFHYAHLSKIFLRIIVKVLKKSLGSKQPLHRMLLNVFGLNWIPKLTTQLRELWLALFIEENDYSMSNSVKVFYLVVN